MYSRKRNDTGIEKRSIENGSHQKQNVAEERKANTVTFLDKIEDQTNSTKLLEGDCSNPKRYDGDRTYMKHHTRNQLQYLKRQHEDNPRVQIDVDEALVQEIIAENDRLTKEVEDFLGSNFFFNDDEDDEIMEIVRMYTQAYP